MDRLCSWCGGHILPGGGNEMCGGCLKTASDAYREREIAVAKLQQSQDSLHRANEEIKALNVRLAQAEDRVETVKRGVRYWCDCAYIDGTVVERWYPTVSASHVLANVLRADLSPSLESAMDAVVAVLKSKGVMK